MKKTTVTEFGFFDKEKVKLIELENDSIKVQVLNLGCTIHSIVLKEINHDIVVSPKKLEGYLEQFSGIHYYFGNTIGRYAGRISEGGFTLNDIDYQLKGHNGVHLHGGENGFHKKIWIIKDLISEPFPKLIMSCGSAHMEEGYPGSITVTAVVSIKNNVLEINYEGISDDDSVLNLTNHTYFNLGYDSIKKDYLKILSNKILECNDELIPTGKVMAIKDSLYDFQETSSLNKVQRIGGLDNTYCFENSDIENPKVTYYSPSSGATMKVSSNQKCVVVFAPKNLSFTGKAKNENHETLQYPAICFEMQNYPDAPNNPDFPSAFLKKGEPYHNRILYKFTVEGN